MNQNAVTISVCVPAFNEELNIEDAVLDLHARLKSQTKSFEIMIVDDGSADNTYAIAQKLAQKYPEIQIIQHAKNKGMGACYRTALQQCQNDFFTWFPSDHENSAKEITHALPYLNETQIVTLNHHGHDNRGFVRRLLSKLYTSLLNRYFQMNLKYYNGLTIAPQKTLKSIDLKSNGFAFSAEILIRVHDLGYSIKELTFPLKGRLSGKSRALRLSVLRNIWKDLIAIKSGIKKRN